MILFLSGVFVGAMLAVVFVAILQSIPPGGN